MSSYRLVITSSPGSYTLYTFSSSRSDTFSEKPTLCSIDYNMLARLCKFVFLFRWKIIGHTIKLTLTWSGQNSAKRAEVVRFWPYLHRRSTALHTFVRYAIKVNSFNDAPSCYANYAYYLPVWNCIRFVHWLICGYDFRTTGRFPKKNGIYERLVSANNFLPGMLKPGRSLKHFFQIQHSCWSKRDQ